MGVGVVGRLRERHLRTLLKHAEQCHEFHGQYEKGVSVFTAFYRVRIPVFLHVGREQTEILCLLRDPFCDSPRRIAEILRAIS